MTNCSPVVAFVSYVVCVALAFYRVSDMIYMIVANIDMVFVTIIACRSFVSVSTKSFDMYDQHLIRERKITDSTSTALVPMRLPPALHPPYVSVGLGRQNGTSLSPLVLRSKAMLKANTALVWILCPKAACPPVSSSRKSPAPSALLTLGRAWTAILRSTRTQI